MSQLDSDVATKVMGWQAEDMEIYGNDTFVWRAATGHQVASAHWSPSTRIEHAWQVVERVKEQADYVTVEKWKAHRWLCHIFVETTPMTLADSFDASADTASEAICRAALAFVDAT